MKNLFHLIYASHAKIKFNEEDLVQLLKLARANNKKVDVTGMLLFDDKNNSFFQILEGTEENIDSLFEKIQKDPRHNDIIKIIKESIFKRAFSEWSMGFRQVTAKDLNNIEGLNDFFGENKCFHDLDSGRAKKLLQAFALGHWHNNDISE
jgi:Mg2+ and Co2+ transporter CorA